MQKRKSRKKPCYSYLIVFISAIYHPFSNSSQTVSWDKSFNPVGTANEFLCLCLQRGLIIVETFWCTLRTRKGNKRTSDPKDHLTLYPLDSIRKYVYHSSWKIPTNIFLQLIDKSIQQPTWDSVCDMAWYFTDCDSETSSLKVQILQTLQIIWQK